MVSTQPDEDGYRVVSRWHVDHDRHRKQHVLDDAEQSTSFDHSVPDKEKSLRPRRSIWRGNQFISADALRSSHLEGQRFASLKAIDTARALADSMKFTPSQIDRMRNATVAALALSDVRVWKHMLSNGRSLLAYTRWMMH